MTPIEAFAMLRTRCIEEIVKGRREVRDLSTPELVEILRLHGCPIPRFAGDGYAAIVAAYDWLGTEEGEREIARFMAPALLPGTRGVYSH
jgi:hypothetical protein